MLNLPASLSQPTGITPAYFPPTKNHGLRLESADIIWCSRMLWSLLLKLRKEANAQVPLTCVSASGQQGATLSHIEVYGEK